MRIKLSFPGSIPFIAAIVGALISASYYLAIMFSQLFIGRPSSTWILGLFWVPVLVFKFGIIGLTIGLIVWLLLRPFYQSRPFSIVEIKVLKIATSVLVLVSVAAGIFKIARYFNLRQ